MRHLLAGAESCRCSCYARYAARAHHAGDARSLRDGARIFRGARAEPEMAVRERLPAAALCRCAGAARDPLVSRRHLPAAMDRKPAFLSGARAPDARARAASCAANAVREREGRRGSCLRAQLRDDARARAVRRDDADRDRARPAAGRDVGLSALVVRAARRADVVCARDREPARLRRYAIGFHRRFSWRCRSPTR